jgi:BMFP domain-containing protein YqiC
MSDTPRMKAAQMAAMEHMTGDVYRVGCDIERKLNAANERINRLEEACRDMVSEEDTYIRLQTWIKAKEAKP